MVCVAAAALALADALADALAEADAEADALAAALALAELAPDPLEQPTSPARAPAATTPEPTFTNWRLEIPSCCVMLLLPPSVEFTQAGATYGLSLPGWVEQGTPKAIALL